MLPSRRPRLAALAALFAAAVGISCRDGLTGPDARGRAAVPLRPVLQQAGDAAFAFSDIARIRVILRRLDGAPALDTVVPVPATTGEALTLALPVTISGTRERLRALLRLIGAQGDTLFAGGPTEVEALGAGEEPSPESGVVGITYAGPGATTARAVRFARRDTTAFFGDTLELPARVLDAEGIAIPGVLLRYASLDTSRAAPAANRRFVLRPVRGPARIVVQTFTGLSDTATVTVQPAPVSVRLIGDGQTGAGGTTLSQPVGVQIVAADSAGVAGLSVRFQVGQGGGAVTDTIVRTDSAGVALTRWELPTASGTAQLTVSVPQVPALGSRSISATAAAGAATRLVVTQIPDTWRAGDVVSPAIVVQAQDAAGNLDAGWQGEVTLVWAINPYGGSLEGRLSVTASGGIAVFDSVFTTRASGGPQANFLRAESQGSGLDAGFSAPFAVGPGPAFRLWPMPNGLGEIVAGRPFTLRGTVYDEYWNIVPTYVGDVTAALGENPTDATLGGTLVRPIVNGTATFDDLTLDRPGIGPTILLTTPGLLAAVTDPILVVPGDAARVRLVTSPPASVAANAPFPIAVELLDSAGNVLANRTDSVFATLGVNPSGATLGGSPGFAFDGGQVAETSISVSAPGAGYRLVVSVPGLRPDTSAAFTVTEAPTGPGLRTWRGTVSESWDIAGNWEPAIVPTPADTVLIAPNSRRLQLAAPVTVAAMRIEDTLDLRSQVEITGDLTVSGAGAIETTAGQAEILVGGTATFGGVASFFSQGIFRFRGNFRQQAGAATSYLSVAGHRSVFEGTAEQSIRFDTPTRNGSRFGTLEVRNPAGVAFASRAIAERVEVNEGQVRFGGAADSITVHQLVMGIDVNAEEAWVPNGGTTVVRNFGGALPNLLPSVVPGRVMIDSVAFSTVALDSAVTIRGSLHVRGELSLASGTAVLRVDSTVVVGDTLGTTAGQVRWGAAGATLDVGRHFIVRTTASNSATTGQLLIGGDFRQDTIAGSTTSRRSYDMSLGHVTAFTGTGPQQVRVASPSGQRGFGNAATRFGRFRVENTQDTVRIASGIAALTMDLAPTAQPLTFVGAADTVALYGDLLTSSPRQFSAAGRTLKILQSPVGVIYPDTIDATLVVDMSPAAFTLPRSLRVLGDVEVRSNFLFGTSGRRLDVAGALRMRGSPARIQLNDPNGVLDVTGPLILSLTTSTLDLQAGRSFFRGGILDSSSTGNIRGVRAHVMELSGATPTLYVANPGITAGSRFPSVRIAAGTEVRYQRVVNQTLGILGSLILADSGSGLPGARFTAEALPLGGRLAVELDSLRIGAGAALLLGATGTLQHIADAATHTFINNGVLDADTTIFGGAFSRTIVPTGTGTWNRRHIRITSGSGQHRLPAGPFDMSGFRLDVRGSPTTGQANFALQGTQLRVAQLLLNGPVGFTMTNAADSIDVTDSLQVNNTGGGATFFAGAISARGAVVNTATSTGNTWAATHRTWLVGSGRQVVTGVAAPTTSSGAFGTLFVQAAVGGQEDSLVAGIRAQAVRVVGTGRAFIGSGATLGVVGTLSAGPGASLGYALGSGFNVALLGATAAVIDTSGTFRPDTLILAANGLNYFNRGPQGEYALHNVAVRGATAGTAGFAPSTVTIGGDLVVDGSLRFLVDSTDYVFVTGNLRTSGNGSVAMTNTQAYLDVRDATFAGNAGAAPTMTDGIFYVRGNFAQATAAQAFRATAAHITRFSPNATHRVGFANPDSATGSFFGTVEMDFSSTQDAFTLDSDLTAVGAVRFGKTAGAEVARISSNVGRVTMTAFGAGFAFDQFQFNEFPFELRQVGLRVPNLTANSLRPNSYLDFVGAFGDGRPVLDLDGSGLYDFNAGRTRFTGVTDGAPVYVRCRSTALTGLTLVGWLEGPAAQPLPLGTNISDPRIVRTVNEPNPTCTVDNVIP